MSTLSCLAKVYIDGRLRADFLPVGKSGGGGDRLIVLLARGHDEDVFALERVGDLLKELCVLIMVLAADDGDGHIHGIRRGLAHLNALIDRPVLTVGVGALEVYGDEVGTGHGGGLFSEIGYGLGAGVVVGKAGHGFFKSWLSYLHAYARPVLDGRVESIERHDIFSAEG